MYLDESKMMDWWRSANSKSKIDKITIIISINKSASPSKSNLTILSIMSLTRDLHDALAEHGILLNLGIREGRDCVSGLTVGSIEGNG